MNAEIDQRKDWLRCRAELNCDEVRRFVVSLYGGQLESTGETVVRRVFAVSNLASRISRRFLLDRDEYLLEEKLYYETACEASGLLYRALEFGLRFEEVVDVSDVCVAKSVASLTPDNRLPPPERRVHWLNQVGLADLPTQLLFTAVASCLAKSVAVLKPNELNRNELKSFLFHLDLVHAVTANLGHLKGTDLQYETLSLLLASRNHVLEA